MNMSVLNGPSQDHLNRISTDALAEVVQYLEGDVIARLFLCGSRLLSSKLSSHHVVHTLDYHNLSVLRMRNLNHAARFENLKTLIIKGHSSYTSLEDLDQDGLMELPISLTKIDFEFENADQCWTKSGNGILSLIDQSRPPFNFKAQFPDLLSLRLRYKPHYMAPLSEQSLKLLPSTLTSLDLPCLTHLSCDTIAHLTSLQYLSIPLASVAKNAMELFCTLPLRNLSVACIVWEKEYDVRYPSTLEELKVLMDWSNVEWLPKLPRTLKSLIAPSLQLKTVDMLLQLPPLLRRLSVSVIEVAVTHLPQSITALQMSLPSTDTPIQDSRLDELPMGLKELHVHENLTLTEKFPKLPMTITKLSLPILLKSPVQCRLLPPNLTSLALLSRVTFREALPVSITELKVLRSESDPVYRLPASLAPLAQHLDSNARELEKKLAKNVTKIGRSSRNTKYNPSLEDGSQSEKTAGNHDFWISARTAIKHGILEIVEWIRKVSGSMDDFENHVGSKSSGLLLAAQRGHLHIFKWLIRNGMHWNHSGDNLPRPLLVSLSPLNKESISSGHSKNASLSDPCPPNPILAFLLSFKEIRNHPLAPTLYQRAISMNNIEALKILDANAVPRPSHSLLSIACKELSKLAMFKCLVEELHEDVNGPIGDDVSGGGHDPRTPIQVLAELGPLELAKILFSQGARADILTSDGRTLAHIASSRLFGALDWLKWLYSINLNLNTLSHPPDQMTPLDVAISHKNTAAISYLKDWISNAK